MLLEFGVFFNSSQWFICLLAAVYWLLGVFLKYNQSFPAVRIRHALSNLHPTYIMNTALENYLAVQFILFLTALQSSCTCNRLVCHLIKLHVENNWTAWWHLHTSIIAFRAWMHHACTHQLWFIQWFHCSLLKNVVLRCRCFACGIIHLILSCSIPLSISPCH
jgi:hypothetical protein